MDHLQGLGERGGAVGQRRALLGRRPISQGGGRLAAREKKGQGRLFLSNDTPRLVGERRPHTGPWPAGPARGRPGGADAAPLGQAGPTGAFCHRTRARPGDSCPHQLAQTFMFSELAGRRRKLGAPCPLRGAARTPRRVPRPGARPALRPRRSPQLHGPGPVLAPVLPSRCLAEERGDAEPDQRARGRLGEGVGGGRGQGQGRRRPRPGRAPNPRRVPAPRRPCVGVGGGRAHAAEAAGVGVRCGEPELGPEARGGDTRGSRRPLVLTCRAGVLPPSRARRSPRGSCRGPPRRLR